MDQIQRKLKPPDKSFFLFGPRGVGKSTWLRHQLPNAFYIDLLKSSTFIERFMPGNYSNQIKNTFSARKHVLSNAANKSAYASKIPLNLF